MVETIDFRPIDRSQHEILLVDDDPVSRYTTSRWLKSAGFRTREAGTGAEGMALADGSISAMVLDVHLPDIDGFELCRLLRSRTATSLLPVLHLSAAFVTDDDKVRGLDSGADAYLTHPVEPAVLVATVQALVRTRIAEEAMRLSEAKFKAIYDQVPGGIALVDDTGVIREGNPALLGLFGRSNEDLAGTRLIDLVPGAWATHAQSLLSMASSGRTVGEFPIIVGRDGLKYLNWQVSSHVEPGVFMVLVTDISERLAMEEQRRAMLEREREARTAAEHLNRMKDEFIAVLSHELRAPLNVIVGWTHVLKRRKTDGPTVDRGLEAIERNTRLQATLISDLLDMSRMNLGKARLATEQLDVALLVEGAIAAIAPAAQASGHQVLVYLRPDLPLVMADPARLQQVLSNLLSNALKFSPAGSTVTIEASSRAGGLLLAVTDQGDGIDEGFLPQLFNRFAQFDSSRNRIHGGLGLGLSIARHLVQAHGGALTAFSEGLGTGARFEVWLPPSMPVTALPPDVAADVLVADSDAQLDGLDLLVVDDDPEVGALLQVILGDRGARVRVAHDYDSALSALDDRLPDLLVSDIGMPGKDGYALIEEVRRREAGRWHIPAVALSSYNRDQDRDRAAAAGFDDYAAKPLRPFELISKIQLLARTPGGASR